jgi:regulator of sigma E protease
MLPNIVGMFFTNAVGLITFVVALVILIILHEFGHFIISRLFKVEVEEFGIGFPPRARTLFKAGGTLFTLNWIPLGGFVKPKGENDPNVPGGLAAANPWVRMAVLLAGPLMNIFLGVALFVGLFAGFGYPAVDGNLVQIGLVTQNSPAEKAGLQTCDIIQQVNGQKVNNVQMLHDTIYANLDKPVQMSVLRNGQSIETSMVPRSNPPAGEGAIGIQMGNPITFQPVPIDQVVPRSINEVGNYTQQLLSLPLRLMQQKVTTDEARPVGIVGMYGIYQDLGKLCVPPLVARLEFFSTITLSLGLLNLLPIPALDGGRILFLLPEIILRRRIPPQYENMVNLISFTLLIVLMLYINAQDVFRLVGR